MAGQRPIDRYNLGFRIGSSSDSQRPLHEDDLVIIDDASEATNTESVRVAKLKDLFIDMAGGTTGLTKNITVETDGGRYVLEFVNGLLVAYRTDNGTGTIDDPYLIGTALQLDAVRNDLAASYKLIADIDLTSYQANEGWVPIGHESDKPFTGNFDGNGFKITDLVSAPATGVAGLFGELSGATITDLEIENGDVTSADNYAGLLFGRTFSSTISGCVVSGKVAGYGASGGLGGIMNSGTITECGANVAVTGTGNSYLGGLIGNGGGAISKCYALGAVDGTGNYAGGLIGQIRPASTITNCYARGAVTATTSVASGGLIGNTNIGSGQTITKNYSSGAVSGGAANNGLIGARTLSDPNAATCLWDITINSGLATPNYGAAGETTANMWKAETYTSLAWDFTAGTGIWAIVEDTSYPTLQWQA